MQARRAPLIPQCEICATSMEVQRVIAETWTHAEFRTYVCAKCGDSRTVEVDAEVSELADA